MLWLIVCLILIFWLAGFTLNIGSLIHLLLVLAIIVVVYQLVSGRRVD